MYLLLFTENIIIVLQIMKININLLHDFGEEIESSLIICRNKFKCEDSDKN